MPELLSLAPDAARSHPRRNVAACVPAQARNWTGTCNRKSERPRRLPPRPICCGDRTTTSARASRPFAYQNRYTITSDYGPFTAPCDARLRRLIREIGAIAQLQAMQETDAFKKAALEAGKSPFRAARSLIDDPVGTLSAIPEGISSIFDRASEQIRRSGRSRYRGRRGQVAPRRVRLQAGTRRETRRGRLFQQRGPAEGIEPLGLGLSRQQSGAGRPVDGDRRARPAGRERRAAPGAGAQPCLIDTSERVVEAQPRGSPTMQVPEMVADGFLQNRALSPRHQTIIVAA